jgi:hypothetical protein
MTTPFEFIDAINNTKENLLVSEESEKEFNTFMILRGLSYFTDTIMQANEMNRYSPSLSKGMVNDFLLHSIRKKKRFSKWHKKPIIENDVELVIDYYNVSRQKAEVMLSLLTKEQLEEIKANMITGGKKR